jgi:cytochrome c553
MKKLLLSLLFMSFLFGETTMCFKENWTKVSQIEQVNLDGGKCNGQNSVSKMKENGWIVDDIKISSGKAGMNYMYIFKKGSTAFVGANANDVSEEILSRVEKRIEAKKSKQRAKKLALKQIKGKKIYNDHCAKCHGKSGEISAYNISRPLNTLTKEQFLVSLRDYGLGQKNNGMAILMTPYANKFLSEDFEQIFKYIQTLK